MKRIISSLVLSVALLGTVVAQEVQRPVAKSNKLVSLLKKYPKTTAAIVTTLVAAGGVGATYYFKPQLVKTGLTKISTAATSTKDFIVAAPGKAWTYTKTTTCAHPYIVGGSVSTVTAASLIAADLLRGEKSIIKKMFRNKKAAAQQV